MYTRDSILSFRTRPECTLVPPELDYEFEFEKRDNPRTVFVSKSGQVKKFPRPSGDLKKKVTPQFQQKINSQFQQKIKKIPADTKHINAILNKLTESNYTKLVEETQTFDYSNPEIVTKIFKKVMNEPCFAKLYARLCKDLEEIHGLIKTMYTSEFSNNKSKNLMIFIGELFNVGLVERLDGFTSDLKTNLDETNLELLCSLITCVGITNKAFIGDIKLLRRVQNNYKPRFRFMILDIIEKV